MKIEQYVTDFYNSNITIVEKGEHVLIIDCGLSPQKVKEIIRGRVVDGILLTHGHYDHSAFCNEYASLFGVKIYANKNIAETLQDKEAIYSQNGEIINNFENFVFIEGDCTMKIGNFEVECYFCPGHSKCSECYIIDKTLYSGDVIFKKSFGRYDLKGSNREELLNSLLKIEKLNFKDVYCGHGEPSNKDEQIYNFAVYKRFLTRK